jgi:ribose-phosphate pyrophosphokinase
LEIYMAEMLTAEQRDSIFLASGRAHPDLAYDVAAEMGISVGAVTLGQHANTELSPRIDENVHGKKVIIVQSHIASEGRSIQDALWEQVMLAGAARQAGAESITAVAPYFGYARSDKRDNDERVPIGAQLVVDALVSAGVSSFAAFDLHAGQIEGFHRGRFLHLHMLPFLAEELQTGLEAAESARDSWLVVAPDSGAMLPFLAEELQTGLEAAESARDSWLVVAPDSGAVKSNQRLADRLGVKELVFMPKAHDPTDSTQLIRWKLGFDPAGRSCILLDDIIDSAGTIVGAAEKLKEAGAAEVHIAATHNVFSGKAVERLQSDAVDRVVVADTHPTAESQAILGEKLAIVKCGPYLGQALMRAIKGGSVSELSR